MEIKKSFVYKLVDQVLTETFFEVSDFICGNF